MVDITFNQAYPSTLAFLYNSPFESGGTEVSPLAARSFEVLVVKTPSDFKIPDWAAGLGVTEPTVYAFCIRQYNEVYYSVEDIIASIGVCYYMFTHKNVGHTPPFGVADGTYLRLTQADIHGLPNPFIGSTLSVDSPMSFLYSFGVSLSNLQSMFISVLNFSIGGYNFWFLIFGSGFIAYMGWVVVKFLIP